MSLFVCAVSVWMLCLRTNNLQLHISALYRQTRTSEMKRTKETKKKCSLCAVSANVS